MKQKKIELQEKQTNPQSQSETSASLLNTGISGQKSRPSRLALLTSVEHPTQSHKIDHVWSISNSQSIKISQVLQDMLSNFNGIKFEINRRKPSRKSPNI